MTGLNGCFQIQQRIWCRGCWQFFLEIHNLFFPSFIDNLHAGLHESWLPMGFASRDSRMFLIWIWRQFWTQFQRLKIGLWYPSSFNNIREQKHHEFLWIQLRDSALIFILYYSIAPYSMSYFTQGRLSWGEIYYRDKTLLFQESQFDTHKCFPLIKKNYGW